MGRSLSSKPGREAAPAAAKRSFLRRLPWEVRLAVLATVYLGPPLFLAGSIALAYFNLSIPDPMALRLKHHVPVVRVLAGDGAVLSERGGGDAYVPIDFLPRHLIDAVVATEDRRFFRHWGVDPAGLVRAAFTNLMRGRVAQGGSTLTQQLAKNLFLGSERTLARKLQELVLALWLEARLGKRDILELYLNRVYFGAGAYGVETAAQRFFGKSAREVNVAEAAMLAGMLKAPSKYSPMSNAAIARERAQGVLAKMVEAGFLSEGESVEAGKVPLRFSDQLQRGGSGVDYAVDAALERVPALVASAQGEIVIETTIDADLQQRAQAMVQAALAQEGAAARASQAGLVLMDTAGAIRALVGGRSYAESQFNRALKAKRQPGSTFKMFVYLAALESGMTPASKVLDLPLLGSGWSPRNEGAGYHGAVSLREALSQSMNAAAARLNLSVGPRATAAVARRLGIRSQLRADASLALGTSEVTLTELTGAYGALASGGLEVEPHLVTRVLGADGAVLFARRPAPARQVVAPAQVAAMNDMLSAVLVSGTGKRAQLPGHPAAGKTGTSQDFRDAWFIGYTGHLVAGVWVGNDDGKPMHRMMGGGLPARLWRELMMRAHKGLAPVPLPGGGPAAAPAVADAELSSLNGNAPLMPRDRISADFFERAAGGDGMRGTHQSSPEPPAAAGAGPPLPARSLPDRRMNDRP
ncbi:MAG TPA: PBP1A family penicillin-binding protein [Hyphomicrobiaceae bacterium]|nr:PBP1A family penicillin-binding protein [Hyphomicrobiaceae bacterium]